MSRVVRSPQPQFVGYQVVDPRVDPQSMPSQGESYSSASMKNIPKTLIRRAMAFHRRGRNAYEKSRNARPPGGPKESERVRQVISRWRKVCVSPRSKKNYRNWVDILERSVYGRWVLECVIDDAVQCLAHGQLRNIPERNVPMYLAGFKRELVKMEKLEKLEKLKVHAARH